MSKKQVQKQPKFTKETLEYYFKAKDIAINASVEKFNEKLLPLAQAFYSAPNEEVRAPFRSAIIDVIYGRIERYQNLVQQVQDNINEQLGDEPLTYTPFNIAKVETVVRRTAQKLFETGDFNAFIESLKVYTKKKVTNGKWKKEK